MGFALSASSARTYDCGGSDSSLCGRAAALAAAAAAAAAVSIEGASSGGSSGSGHSCGNSNTQKKALTRHVLSCVAGRHTLCHVYLITVQSAHRFWMCKGVRSSW
jgi:hypothetical protein